MDFCVLEAREQVVQRTEDLAMAFVKSACPASSSTTVLASLSCVLLSPHLSTLTLVGYGRLLRDDVRLGVKTFSVGTKAGSSCSLSRFVAGL